MRLSKGTFLSLVAAASLAGASTEVFAGKAGFEKCHGIAKKGMNDCGANGHACGGYAKTDGDKNEWVYVKEGTCKKIVGGSLTSPEKQKKMKKLHPKKMQKPLPKKMKK